MVLLCLLAPDPFPPPHTSWSSEKVGSARSSCSAVQTCSGHEAAVSAACFQTSSCTHPPTVWAFISRIS